MKLESAKCTTCGANLKIEIDAHTAECKFCHNQIIVKNAFDFAKVELDRTKDIKNYRNNLAKAVKNSNFEEILRISSLIKDIIPNDFSANYYFALSKQKLGYPKFMYDFFEEEYPSTEDESKQIFEHIISNSDLRDYSRVKKYLSVRSEVALQNFETEYVLRTRVEDNYANIPRDVFICFSSANIETANKISKTLEADGYATWISTKNLRPNNKDNYWSDIEKAIINNSIVLVISSAEAMVSKDVQHELELAKKHNKKLIELKIDSSAHTTFFKYIFNGIKWIDGKTINNKVIQDLKDRIFEEIQDIKKSRSNNIKIPQLKSLLNAKSISLIFVLLFLTSFTLYQTNVFGIRGLFETPISSTNSQNFQNSSLSASSNIVSTPNSSSSINSSNSISIPVIKLDYSFNLKSNYLRSISFDKTDIESGELLNVSLEAVDPSNDIKDIQVLFIENEIIRDSRNFAGFMFSVNLSKNINYKNSVIVPSFSKSRKVKVSQINITTNDNQNFSIIPEEEIIINILAGTEIDNEKPYLIGVTTYENNRRQIIKVTAGDNLSGIRNIGVSFYRKDNDKESGFIGTNYRERTSYAEFEIDVNSQISFRVTNRDWTSGVYYVHSIEIVDQTGNKNIYYDYLEKWNLNITVP
jgi:DNA-directed RNA polymerase subunit RPC12/RpoP